MEMADSTSPPPASASVSSPANEHEHESDNDNDSSPPNSPPLLSRSHSSASSSAQTHDSDDWDIFPPLDKLTIFDYLDQFTLPQRLEKLNRTYLVQKDKVKQGFKQTKAKAILRTDLELIKYREKYNKGLDKLVERWNDNKVVSTREKISFVVGVSNVFITGFLIGGYPEWMHVWYSLQLLYFMPIRYFTYHNMGYHYFLADLCYFVNVMLLLAIWVFPNSRRLMISAYCLSYGNNAWAIAMWRNSMVFHSLDKVTSLFIHIMPPVVLHCLVHLIDPVYCEQRFPAISRIKHVQLYGLREMIIWATVPYAIWQLSYHVFITVRRREKIAAGRPTSFTWLKKSYRKTWIGKIVIGLPEALQEPAFMFIQYSYAVLTMLPCPLWFYHRKFSALFISAVGIMSIYNGATFYIDVFGKRFQKELEQFKKDAAKWQSSPEQVKEELRSNPGVDNIAQLNPQITDQEVKSTGYQSASQASEVQVRSAPAGSATVDA